MHQLYVILVGAVVAGAIAALIQWAPFEVPKIKQIALWLVLAVFVLWAIRLLFPGVAG